MSVLKSLVATSYDNHVQNYARSSQMQSANLARLLDLAEPHIRQSQPRQVLDVGCGNGSAVPELRSRALFPIESYLGIDLSPEMVGMAARRFGDDTTSFLLGDAERIPAADDSVDIVISNTVLHWLNQPTLGSTPAKAFTEAARCLRKGGAMVASIAGIGTGRRFLKAYRQAIGEMRQVTTLCEPLFLENPVGCMHLHEAVAYAEAAGFRIVLAQLDYEPALFPSALHYCEAVRAYGYSIFMAALAQEKRESGWEHVCRSFVSAVGDGPYLHDQYMCYLVARKPS
jgi:ubiquinone/menaquinone biosynthesis C-methylase UbiE